MSNQPREARAVVLSVFEQGPIDRSEHYGNGWVLPIDMTAETRAYLAWKGLVRYWQNRWQLTPLGFSHTLAFRRGDRAVSLE